MICTSCHTDDGTGGISTEGLTVEAVALLCKEWKCTECLNVLMRGKAREAAEHFRGTCASIETSEYADFLNDAAFCAELDSEVMCCEGCGWWCETGEFGETGVCEDCDPEEEADD